MQMKESDMRADFVAVLDTPYISFNGSCMELNYFFVGNGSIEIIVVSENQTVRIIVPSSL